jgi:hypothetical protein
MACAAGLSTAAWPPIAHAQGTDAKEDPSARTIDILNLPFPVARQGRLVNYIFVSLQLTPAQGQDIWKLRERTHFLRDAYLKLVHIEDLSDPGDPRRLDIARTRARLLAATDSLRPNLRPGA